MECSRGAFGELLERLRVPWRRLGEALGLPWELQGRPRKALGVLRECLGEAFLEAFWSSEDASEADIAKSKDLQYLSSENHVFESPEAPI